MPEMPGWVAAGAAIASALLVGCGGAAEAGSTVSTRDSAGISIVENAGPLWAPGRGWTVIDTPLVAIDEVDHVRGPVRLSDGRLAIANGGTNEVRIYDAGGARLKSSGRTGNGPGEYQNLVGIWVGPGDSLLVSDILERRMTVLDREGAVGRSFSLGSGGSGFVSINGGVDFAVPIGWMSDGSIISFAQTFRMNAARDGIFRDTLAVVRYGPDGTARDTVGRFPGPEMEQMTLSMGGHSMATPLPVPLGRQLVATARGERFYVAVNSAWEIQARGLDGSLKRLIRASVAPAAITSADAEANRKELREQMESNPMMRSAPEPIRKQFTSRIDQARYPATFAFFTGLLADAAGNLWAEEVSPSSQQPQRYAVIDSAGRFLGRVTMPANFRASSIGADAVFGVWKDADDLEHVRGYPLRKGPAN